MKKIKMIFKIKRFFIEIIRYLFGYKKLDDEFFDTKKTDYDKLVGRCFELIGGGEVIKVLAIPKNDKETDTRYVEFIFERYEHYLIGKWYIQDYNWLQENVYGECGINNQKLSKVWHDHIYKYKQYADISPQADMNVCSEDMYHLGKDGNIYVNVACGDTWLKYKEISNKKFERIKAKAIKNGKFELNGTI